MPDAMMVPQRSRRANAGNRMRELLEQQEIDGGDEMFAEVENDIEFEGNDDESDVVDSDFDESSEEEKSDEDVEAEQALAREERRERKAAARPRAMPLHALRPALGGGRAGPTVSAAPRTERRPRPPVVAPTPGVVRSSSRRATVQSKIKTQTKLQEAEERRASVRARPVRKRTKFLTQDALISEALETEEENIQSLHRFLAQEEERKARQRASGKKGIEGPFLRWVSVGLSQSVFTIRAQQKEAEARAAAAARAEQAERERVQAEKEQAEHEAAQAQAEREAAASGEVVPKAEEADVPAGATGDAPARDETAPKEAAPGAVAPNEEASGAASSTAVPAPEATASEATAPSAPAETTAPSVPAEATASEPQAPAAPAAPLSHPKVSSAAQADPSEASAPAASMPTPAPQAETTSGAPATPRSASPTPSTGPAEGSAGTPGPSDTAAAAADTPSVPAEPLDYDVTARTLLSLYNLAPNTTWPEEFRLLLGDHCEWDRQPIVPSRNRPFRPRQSTCVITGLPARYRDPVTGVAYATKEAFHTLRRVLHNEYRWTGSETRTLPMSAGCYVARMDDAGAAGVFAEAQRRA
ncbi:hypothetical protein MBRA1_003136 [Malassezia brasiliensis]|uniref:Vps72/YL1 C-terminal domain-containing protein n=1 Tax=Malassezia brasiliensis TaxID=1821822 RepID=A0AAF0IPQ3_9BASI|nr:hypothetical protein MBRA1_003136 [Malassezia brasiliensis]